MHEQVHCHDEAANHQLPTAAAFWITWKVSMEECSSLMQNLMQIHFSTHSVILNMTPTIFTCSLCGVYCPHPLVQWSRHCSRIHIPVHSPWLPGYTNVTQAVLLILTMARLFLDRPHILFSHTYEYSFSILQCFKIKQEVNSEMCHCGWSAVRWELSHTPKGRPNCYNLPRKQFARIY